MRENNKNEHSPIKTTTKLDNQKNFISQKKNIKPSNSANFMGNKLWVLKTFLRLFKKKKNFFRTKMTRRL